MKKIKMLGRQFGQLLVIKDGESTANGELVYICKCECGQEIGVRGYSLRRGDTKSCGCLTSSKMVGRIFGKLTVVSASTKYHYKNKTKFWDCKCACGESTTVSATHLTTGHTRSCGCMKKRFGKDDYSAALKGIFFSYKNSAERRKLPFLLTFNFFSEEIFNNCYYCNSLPDTVKKRGKVTVKYNGLDRIDNLQGYTEDNVVPCCAYCNWIKRDFSADKFLTQVRKVYEHSCT